LSAVPKKIRNFGFLRASALFEKNILFGFAAFSASAQRRARRCNRHTTFSFYTPHGFVHPPDAVGSSSDAELLAEGVPRSAL
jgi:hypothetical protein